MYNENVTAYFYFQTIRNWSCCPDVRNCRFLRLAAKEALFHKQQIWRRTITVLTISTRLFSNTVNATINMKALIDCKKLALEFTRLQNLTGTTFSDNFSPWITILIFLIAILILLFAIK